MIITERFISSVRRSFQMIYTDMTKKAMKFCYEAHKGQYDKGGVPYVFHPFHLAESMDDEISVTAALLHDVLEDTPFTEKDLLEEGFSEEVIRIVKLLTRDHDTPYLAYVGSLAHDPVARKIKLADLEHNTDASRLPYNKDFMKKRFAMYEEAKQLLKSMS